MAGNNPATQNTRDGGIIAAENSTNMANVIRGLMPFDGRDPAELKAWMKKICVFLGVIRRDILPQLKNERKPDPSDTVASESYTRSNEDLHAIPFPLVKLPAALLVQEARRQGFRRKSLWIRSR